MPFKVQATAILKVLELFRNPGSPSEEYPGYTYDQGTGKRLSRSCVIPGNRLVTVGLLNRYLRSWIRSAVSAPRASASGLNPDLAHSFTVMARKRFRLAHPF